MRVRVVGAGIYGLHLALTILQAGHNVKVYESEGEVFAGASGNMPARLHVGPHYPRSKKTRDACKEHGEEFIKRYGYFTKNVPINVYAIAETDSLVDFGTYLQILRQEVEFITVYDPREFGLENVEGAILTGERHVVVDEIAKYLCKELGDVIFYNRKVDKIDDHRWDLTIDASGCAYDNLGVDRYEACLTLLLRGPTSVAITICDGPFCSLYPWDEARGLSSLTSAKWTPMARFSTWREARSFLDGPEASDAVAMSAQGMLQQMRHFYPRVADEYEVVDRRLAIRAMPRSASDARLVDVVRVGERALRVRAGKLDAIFHAERVIMNMLPEFMPCVPH